MAAAAVPLAAPATRLSAPATLARKLRLLPAIKPEETSPTIFPASSCRLAISAQPSAASFPPSPRADQTEDRRHPRLSRPDSCPSHPYRPTRIHQRFWFRLLAQNRQFFICGRTIRAQTSRSSRSVSRFTVRKMIRFSLSPNPSEINTYRCVSKQTTLTIFRMNTYVKQGEGGLPLFTTLSLSYILSSAVVRCVFRDGPWQEEVVGSVF